MCLNKLTFKTCVLCTAALWIMQRDKLEQALDLRIGIISVLHVAEK